MMRLFPTLALGALLTVGLSTGDAATTPTPPTPAEDIPALFAAFTKTVNLIDVGYCTLTAIDGKTFVCLAREEKGGPVLSYNCRADAGCWPRMPADVKPGTP